MGRKVRFSALHRTALRLARDFSDSFSMEFSEVRTNLIQKSHPNLSWFLDSPATLRAIIR
jgi:hypothetical protein